MRVQSSLADVLADRQEAILHDWIREQVDSGAARPDLISDQTHRTQCASILEMLAEGVRGGETEAKSGPNWNRLKDTLADLSKARARQGFSPAERSRRPNAVRHRTKLLESPGIARCRADGSRSGP